MFGRIDSLIEAQLGPIKRRQKIHNYYHLVEYFRQKSERKTSFLSVCPERDSFIFGLENV